ncbi:MAG TPA: response regulator [Patescibacteria group bacterium]|nr:response regulator [Patescibacteria group bacterium]
MKTCLVVDDSSIVRKLSTRLLAEIGLECREAEDGQQALDACRAGMPDVILLDWNMPIMNGIDCIRHLRAWPEAAGVKVIFCTTHGDMTQIQEALAAGADEYIMKPFDGEILATKLRQVGIV